ncbi:MAG: TetR-like C-terminal domain-containing protein [Actinomycetota bacterium]
MPPSNRGAGRPPGPHDDTLAKLLPVALRLFLDEGGQALTPTRLHVESGVGRATIYRNWPEPEDLIEIMLGYATEPPPVDVFVGDVERDLIAAVDILLDRFEHRPARAFFAACIDYGRRSERMATVSSRFIDGILAPFHTVISQAVESGELTGDPDELVAALAGPLMLDHVILGKTIQRRRAHALVEEFLSHRGNARAGSPP